MDAPGHQREVIVQNLGDLRRCNRLLGGVRLSLRPLARLAEAVPPGQTLRVLDVATGGADIPRALARWARREGQALFLVASDVSEAFVAIARQQSAAEGPVCGTIHFVVADARQLPFLPQAFDVTTCSLALHHMLRDEALAMLGELRRCADRGVVVNDIVRGWLGYVGAFVATRLGSRNVLTWHDGPLSVLRAYTKEEMFDLARQAGLRPLRCDGFLFYRLALTAVPVAPATPGATVATAGAASRAAGVP
jgi:ubiquinone/menaquinone biosynthesis C-methylase UbiE